MTEEAFPAAPHDPALVGRFFAAAGEEVDLDLYELKFAPERLYRLTDVGRVGGIGACPDRLVASAAQQAVGFQDTLQEFRAGKLTDVEGLGSPKASLPELAPDCRVVYTEVDRSAPELVELLVRWDPATGERAVLYSAVEELAVPDWGPGGRIAALEGTIGNQETPSATGLVLVSPDGVSQVVAPPVPEFGALHWGQSPWIAIDQTDKTVFFNPETSERAELAGWVPLAWSPDGARLLVADAEKRTEVALVEATDLMHVRVVGEVGAALWDVVWLPQDALPDIPEPTGRPTA